LDWTETGTSGKFVKIQAGGARNQLIDITMIQVAISNITVEKHENKRLVERANEDCYSVIGRGIADCNTVFYPEGAVRCPPHE